MPSEMVSICGPNVLYDVNKLVCLHDNIRHGNRARFVFFIVFFNLFKISRIYSFI